ncbi:glycosyltransferase family 4 protein [Herbiconiux sp. CPCC 205716]|uniref:Glycosyltransferase family 4 protein n=1 Tax=Herbiconiux gentiana TaxID=2970912 RepID=A0ABT2GMR4_9MICO|nr:glycosyltransferase family 1 protein [Herbiconiux gentiana]MCS5716209.1 glycosyltransferase family 4 protein [Herbiconiux gentiana]
MSTQIPVLLDATSLPPSWGGVARYIEGLLTGLDELGVALDVVVKPGDLDRLRAAAPGHRYHAGPASLAKRPVRFAWEQLGLPRLAKRLGARAVHSPHYTFPLLTRRSRIVTLHDATFFTDPGVHSRLKRTFFTSWTRWAGRRATALVAPSRATAAAVRDAVPVRAEIRVAYLGVDPEVFRPPAPAAVDAFAAAHGLGGTGWIAFLGTIEPRKNVPALLGAYASLRADRRARDLTTPELVLSGSRGWDEEAARLLDTPGEGVTEAGYLPLEELGAFLGGATVVAYPSLGEGFGLPVLEAMACGGTVLTTDRLSIPEVGGDAVAYTEPDAHSIAVALEQLLDEPGRRAELSRAALERSHGFTWAACARVHLDAYAAAGVTVEVAA